MPSRLAVCFNFAVFMLIWLSRFASRQALFRILLLKRMYDSIVVLFYHVTYHYALRNHKIRPFPHHGVFVVYKGCGTCNYSRRWWAKQAAEISKAALNKALSPPRRFYGACSSIININVCFVLNKEALNGVMYFVRNILFFCRQGIYSDGDEISCVEYKYRTSLIF